MRHPLQLHANELLHALPLSKSYGVNEKKIDSNNKDVKYIEYQIPYSVLLFSYIPTTTHGLVSTNYIRQFCFYYMKEKLRT